MSKKRKLTKNQKKALKFVHKCGGSCGWNEKGLSVKMSERLVDLAFMELVESFLETETWKITKEGKKYVK